MKLLKLLFLNFLVVGCAHSIHQVHVSDFSPQAPIESGKMIKAQGDQFVVFWFTDNTNFVNQAYQKLQNECPNGRISGITTEYTTNLGFLSWTNKVIMQGLCIN